MKKGQKVKVYQQPLAQADYEGTAKVVKVVEKLEVHEGTFFECLVDFEDGYGKVHRTIFFERG